MLKTFSPNTQSFEETFKTAYSHGLEEIYSLENVDLSSVKPISIEQPKEIKRKKGSSTTPSQLVFDFCRTALPPFYLMEPIQVLSLSKPLEKNLLDQGKTVLAELIEGDYTVVGQGYKDEIHHRLEAYLKEHDGRAVDFFSLIRCCTGTVDRRKGKVALEPYHLGDAYTLTPLENMEIKRLLPARRKEWIQEFNSKMDLSFARDQWTAIVDTYLKPWIEKRCGLATREELLERLQQISEFPEATEGVVHFFSAILNQTLFDALLCPVDEDLYCLNSRLFSKVIAAAATYFYKSHIRYALSELTRWLLVEFATEWEWVPEPFIVRAIRLSSQFSVRKGEDGQLWVKMV